MRSGVRLWLRRLLPVLVVGSLLVGLQVHAQLRPQPSELHRPPPAADLGVRKVPVLVDSEGRSPLWDEVERSKSEPVIASVAGRWQPKMGERGWLGEEPGSGYGVLLLHKGVSRELVTDLEGLGLQLLGVYPARGLLAHVPPDGEVLAALAADPRVTWAGRFPPQLKIHPVVRSWLDEGADAGLLPGEALLRISLIEDNPATRSALEPRLERLGMEVVREDSVSLWLAGAIHRASELAELPSVLHVTQGWLGVTPSHEKSMPLVYADRSRVAFDYLPHEGAGSRVGIIDSGYTPTHESLPDPTFHRSFVNEPGCNSHDLLSPLEDASGHGTHIAGTVFGRGSGEFSPHQGVAPRVTDIAVARIFGVEEGAGGGFSHGDAPAAVEWMAEEVDADVVNNSWGCCMAPDDPGLTCDMNAWHNGTSPDSVLIDRVSYERGGSWVVAAGNYGNCRLNSGEPRSSISSPAAAKNAITVGNLYAPVYRLARYSASSVGPTADGRQKPDLLAPGYAIDSADFEDDHGYRPEIGTSMAAPHVTGAIALLQEAVPEVLRRPDGVKALLRATALPVLMEPTDHVGAGRLETFKLIGDRNQADGWERILALGSPLFEGEVGAATIDVPVDSQRLTVVLAWTEPPASVGAVSAGLNNLDLLVHGPDETQYGFSVSAGDTVETVIIDDPAPGRWDIEVQAWSVTSPLDSLTQDFALGILIDRGRSLGVPKLTLTCPSQASVGESVSCLATVTSEEGIASGVRLYRGTRANWGVKHATWWLRDGSPVEQALSLGKMKPIYLGDVGPADQRMVELEVVIDSPGVLPVNFGVTSENNSLVVIEAAAVYVE
ncbi:MAG: S8 family serine peptidase [Myxococcota bacterium]|nr:S8 family serine peptidase [Myxococcota bacterium]